MNFERKKNQSGSYSVVIERKNKDRSWKIVNKKLERNGRNWQQTAQTTRQKTGWSDLLKHKVEKWS